jgi:NTE family protein
MSYRNIVFEGGGVLGVAYIGVIRELYNHGVLNDIHGYAGSSAGSIAATVLACRADMKFIEEKLKSLDMRALKDDSYNAAIDVYNIIRNYGFCKGDKLRGWIGDILKELTGSESITFKQVYDTYNSTLVITGTSLNTLSTVYYSHLSHPNMPVRDAIRISASIPYFFSAVHFEGDVLVDGGVLNNYPLSVFDDNKFKTTREEDIDKLSVDGDNNRGVVDGDNNRDVADGDNNDNHDNNRDIVDKKSFIEDPNNRTIGIKLVSNSEIHGKWPPVTNIKTFSINLLEAMMMQIAQGHVRGNDWKRTIKVNVGEISSTDFDLDDQQKEWLIGQGEKTTIEFFANIKNPKISSKPVNINDNNSIGAIYEANRSFNQEASSRISSDGRKHHKKSKRHRRHKSEYRFPDTQ